jgi:hypothetical protein
LDIFVSFLEKYPCRFFYPLLIGLFVFCTYFSFSYLSVFFFSLIYLTRTFRKMSAEDIVALFSILGEKHLVSLWNIWFYMCIFSQLVTCITKYLLTFYSQVRHWLIFPLFYVSLLFIIPKFISIHPF